MNFNSHPLLDNLSDCKNILIAGAGGGFDIFSGLPLYFHLKKCGKNVHLANLTFTNILSANGEQITQSGMLVNADTNGPTQYFPEKYLCEWFEKEGNPLAICCIDRDGVKPIIEVYKKLIDMWQIDAIVLVDGGTDSLMRGDEYSLATPEEDLSSIAAVHAIDLEHKYLTCLGFGVDTFHGINHYYFLEAVAELTKSRDFLGITTVLPEMQEAQDFKRAYQYVESRMPLMPSIVATSVIAAVDGEYGDYHSTKRTRDSKLWINPLMNLYWSFNLNAVAERCLYLDALKDTSSFEEVRLAIQNFRIDLDEIRTKRHLPA